MKILTVVGARPNFVKVAPLHHALLKHPSDIRHVIVHTGQHYDDAMSGRFFEQFRLPQPDHNLDVKSGSHAEQTGLAMMRLEPVMASEKPDWVVVVGDVNAALAGAITAKKLGLRVAHIEAGLRSNDWSMPEEINRVIVDRVSDLLLTTSEFADHNLRDEGVNPDRIARVGNIMIDSLTSFLSAARGLSTKQIIGHESLPKFALVTLHRPSNVDYRSQLEEIAGAIETITRNLTIVFPLHPRTRLSLEKFGLMTRLLNDPRLIITEPLGYVEMLALQQRASIILTDSGGIQEEAMVLGVPCVTLRTTTERPETLAANGGTSRLATLTRDGIVDAFTQARDSGAKAAEYPLWDGHAAERIVAELVRRGEA